MRENLGGGRARFELPWPPQLAGDQGQDVGVSSPRGRSRRVARHVYPFAPVLQPARRYRGGRAETPRLGERGHKETTGTYLVGRVVADASGSCKVRVAVVHVDVVVGHFVWVVILMWEMVRVANGEEERN